MIDIIDTKSWIGAKGSYVVWHDITVGNTDGIFILHMEKGKHTRSILPWFKWAKKEEHSIFFCEGLQDVWKNHRKFVGTFEDGLKVYQWIN